MAQQGVKNVIVAVIKCAKKPSESEIEKLKDFLAKKYDKEINIEFQKDESIQEGFLLEVTDNSKDGEGTVVFDWTIQSRLDQLKNELNNTASHNNGNIVTMLKSAIENFEPHALPEEIGAVVSVGDGVVTISGLQNVAYGEIVVFQSGAKGLVQNINTNTVGCVLFDSDSEVSQGDKAIRTKKNAGVPVSDAFIGRIINSLGEPIDGLGEIKADSFRPVECDAPSIPQRQSVCQPLETGILSIDSMFPIGKGQRELIIGDRQTGKTSIAVDTIINQKGKDVICIYNAIGQKASSVAKIVSTLKRHGAMEYTVIVCSTASEPASLQYISPYSATALAEYFMYKGKDVLIIYDDLSKHAVAYRSLSLLLGRSPGREAYPGDVFYLHSRLLERSSKLTDSLGGGSITALPIIETQAGDVSAYIPTNVISITDGQIFLESDLFFSGMRPAINVGLSVSRVGGAAQSKAMKKASGTLRVDLAQYREIEVFSQFSSDLDEDTKLELKYGSTLMEMLKQPLYSPLSMAKQVVSLVVASDKQLVDLELTEVKPFMNEFLSYVEENHSVILQRITNEKVLTDDIRKSILDAVRTFKGGRAK